MKTILKVSLFAMAALGLASCAPPATNTNTNSNTNTAPKAAVPPTADSLAALEKQAWDAFGKKDMKFFEGFLADTYVGFGDDGKRPTRAESIKMIGEYKCEMKSFAFSDTKVTMAGADAAVLTYKVTQDGTCDGQKIPSLATVATVFVRSGDSWKAAYHNEVAFVEPKADANSNTNSNASATADDKKKEAAPVAEKKESAPAANASASSNSNSNTNSAAPASDALTDALVAVERRGWEAWMKQDAKALEGTVTKDITFVNTMGKVTSGQAEVIKGWTDGSCKVSSVDVSDAKGSMITKDAAILTFKGTGVGTCSGVKLDPLWGTSVFVKEGDAWKAVYIFETPMRKA